MSLYRGDKLIAAGGRDVNPHNIISGCNICVAASPDDKCVIVNTVQNPTFEDDVTVCCAVSAAAVCACSYKDENGCDMFQNVVTTPNCCYQKICCLTEASYQALVSSGTVDPETYYFTSGTAAGCFGPNITTVCFNEGLCSVMTNNQLAVCNPSMNFSTTPQKIGKWINGCDLYAATYEIPMIAANCCGTCYGCCQCFMSLNYAHGLTDITPVGFNGYWKSASGNVRTAPYMESFIAWLVASVGAANINLKSSNSVACPGTNTWITICYICNV